MSFSIKSVETHVVDVVNKPGMMARILEGLSNAGANLEFVIGRRVNENTSRLFFAPIQGAKQTRSAADLGLQRASGMHCLRVEGPDRAGLGAAITRGIAAAGINMRGLSAAAVGKRSVCYIAFASAAEASQAGKAIKKALAAKPAKPRPAGRKR